MKRMILVLAVLAGLSFALGWYTKRSSFPSPAGSYSPRDPLLQLNDD